MSGDNSVQIVRRYDDLNAPTGESTRLVDEYGRVWQPRPTWEQYPQTGVIVGKRIGNTIRIDNTK